MERKERYLMNGKLRIWILFAAVLTLHTSQQLPQSASFTCLQDVKNDNLMHIDVRLNRRDDTVTAFYAYDVRTIAPRKGCLASTKDGGQSYHIRVTVTIGNNSQTAPLESCGTQWTNPDTYELWMRSEASDGLVVSTDRLYKCSCNSSNAFVPWVQTPGNQVGNVDTVNLTSSRTTLLTPVQADDNTTKVVFATLGTLVRFKFQMEFSSNKELIDIVGARLKNFIVSPTDTYSFQRTLIDDNGCAVNQTSSALSLDGPFVTVSNGSSPFVALSPVMEVGKFAESFSLNFRVFVEYCVTTSSSKCFKNMCESRTRRSTSDLQSAVFTTKLIIQEKPVSSIGDNGSTTNCFLTLGFALILGTTIFLLFLDGCVIVYLLKKFKSADSDETTCTNTTSHLHSSESTC